MSLWYTLEIATNKAAEQVLQLMAEEMGLELTDKGNLAVPDAVFISAREKSKTGQSIIEEAFGFRPNINVGFRIYSKDDYREGKRIMARTSVALLRQGVREAVLLYNGEDTVMLKLNGQLLLNQGWDELLAPELEAASMLYERRELTSPLLQ